jgi:hypothetical protein
MPRARPPPGHAHSLALEKDLVAWDGPTGGACLPSGSSLRGVRQLFLRGVVRRPRRRRPAQTLTLLNFASADHRLRDPGPTCRYEATAWTHQPPPKWTKLNPAATFGTAPEKSQPMVEVMTAQGDVSGFPSRYQKTIGTIRAARVTECPPSQTMFEREADGVPHRRVIANPSVTECY